MRHLISLLFAVALLLPAPAFSQASSGTVRGTVRDQVQAIIPGAKVMLVNTATNASRETLSNEAGLYVFPGVIPGPYRLAAEFAGMQRFEGDLTLQVQQDATVDVTLRVAQAAVTTVDVQDVTPLLNTVSPTLGQTLERQRIQQLPINGRGYQNLLATVPGITERGRVRAYGAPVNTHALMFDGSPTNEVWEGWDFGRVPGLDAIEELRVDVSSSSAKFTRPTTIILSSKSGTNQFHGAMFETNRNSGYGVARRRQDYFEKPPYLNRNEFGVSAGGPLYLPKIYDGRNRTFFFASWEALRQRAWTTNRFNVPTAEMRNGDFRGLVDSQGRLQTLYDPFTTNSTTWARQPLAYRGVANTIDPARLSPVAKFLFDLTPLPNLPVSPLVDSNLIIPTLIPRKESSTSVRLDHRFSDKDLIYGRITYGTNDHWLGTTVLLPMTIGDYPKAAGTSNRHWPSHTGSMTWVRTLSPTLTNELLLTGSRDFQWRGSGDAHTNYSREALGLPNPFQAPNWPNLTGVGMGSYPFGTGGLFWLITNYGMLQDNATKIKGKHEFQFGVHYRYEMIDRSSNSTAGPFDSATQATALYDSSSTPASPQARPQTGHGIANFYLGIMNYSAGFQRPWVLMRRHEYAGYFQDNWKVTPRLTLNLGLRYEMRPPIGHKRDTLVGFSMDHRAYVVGTDVDRFVKLGETLPSILTALRSFGGDIISYKDAGLPKNLVNTNWLNFGPRLGVAYRAFDGAKSFVIRSGFRTSYYTQPISRWYPSQSSSQIVSNSFSYSVTNTALSPDGVPSYGLRSVPSYVAGVNTPDSVINTSDTRLITRGFTANFMNPDLPDPRIHDWNFTLEKEVMQGTVVRAAYVGNAGRKQQQTHQLNASTPEYIWLATQKTPLPTGEFSNVARRTYDKQVWGNINRYDMTGFTNHHSFQLEMERRYSKGVGFQVFWITGNTLGNGAWEDSVTVLALNNFLPGTVPTDDKERNRALNYGRDAFTPKHEIRWNWIVDLPFGRGKKFGGSARGMVDKLIGGWQIAGLGNWRTNYLGLPSNIYPNGNPIELYGYKYPIEDCRSGICYPGYLWWNGYIPANRINSRDAQGRPNGIMGVPADYKPAGAPLIPWGSTALPPNAPANTNVSQFWDTNTVWVPLSNGTVQRTTYNDNNHPWRKDGFTGQLIPGVNRWNQDASLFKFVNVTERVTLRFNVDFFNVFNHPNNPTLGFGECCEITSTGSDGILPTRNSGSSARVTQLTVRLMW